MIALLLTDNPEHAVLMAAQAMDEGIMPLWPQHLLNFPPRRARFAEGVGRLVLDPKTSDHYRAMVAELLPWCDEVWIARAISDEAATELNLFREEESDPRPIRFFTAEDLAEAQKCYTLSRKSSKGGSDDHTNGREA